MHIDIFNAQVLISNFFKAKFLILFVLTTTYYEMKEICECKIKKIRYMNKIKACLKQTISFEFLPISFEQNILYVTNILALQGFKSINII